MDIWILIWLVTLLARKALQCSYIFYICNTIVCCDLKVHTIIALFTTKVE